MGCMASLQQPSQSHAWPWMQPYLYQTLQLVLGLLKLHRGVQQVDIAVEHHLAHTTIATRGLKIERGVF